jgi:hypothetical protein
MERPKKHGRRPNGPKSAGRLLKAEYCRKDMAIQKKAGKVETIPGL